VFGSGFPVMLRPILFILSVGLIIVATNLLAEHRAKGELILRLCQNREHVLSDLNKVLHKHEDGSDAAMSSGRSRMIAAKLLFIVPQQGGESDDVYLKRLQSYLDTRCGT